MNLKKDYKRELQLKMLEMMKVIDEICKKNNIEYYLVYGSALGAVRHKGFIPWDDDFDIAMTDDNYYRFLEICENELDKNKYYVQTPEKEKNYYLSFSKIRDITTTLIEESNNDKDITYGVFIDIFPLVGVPENKIKRNILKINRAFMLSANINVINNSLLKLIFKIILKLFGKKRILNYCTKQCFKYKAKDHDVWISICDGDGFERNEVSKDVMGKPKYVEFEDIKLPIPNKFSKYLEHFYGDYMKIPSEEEIKNKEHTPYFIDLNMPYEEYIKSHKKKKILFIIWSFSYGGGAEKILANIVNNLDYNRYDIDIIEYWHTNIKNERVNKNINVLSPIIDADKDNKFKKICYKILLECFPSILRNKYIKKQYDIEISFNYLIPTFLLSKKTKTISWIHGDIYDLKSNKRNYKLQQKSFKYVDKIVAISDNTFNSLKDVYPEYNDKLTLINNGFSLDEIVLKSNEEKVKKEKYLLFINRFDSNKNPLYVLDVVNELYKRGHDFKLLYLGKGDLEDKIKYRIKELNLTDKVEIIGYKSNPYPYIKNSYMVLGCSKSEGFPTIFIEAITLGVPFVTTDVGGVKEISNNQKCGYIATDFNDYIDKVEKLLNDKKLYKKFSTNGLEHAKKFSINNQIEQIEKLIDEVTK